MANDESTLTVKRVIDADPNTLFEALTDQQIMKQWFFASGDAGWSASVENDPREGGRLSDCTVNVVDSPLIPFLEVWIDSLSFKGVSLPSLGRGQERVN